MKVGWYRQQVYFDYAAPVNLARMRAVQRQMADGAVEDEVRKTTLNQALALAPMDLCPWKGLARKTQQLREWWRYGWAAGFIELGLANCLASVTQRSYRTVIKVGYDAGHKARAEFECVTST